MTADDRAAGCALFALRYVAQRATCQSASDCQHQQRLAVTSASKLEGDPVNQVDWVDRSSWVGVAQQVPL